MRAKAAGAKPAGQMRDERFHAFVAHNKMFKTPHVRSTFGRRNVQKVHPAMAQSTSGNLKNEKLRILTRLRRSDVVSLKLGWIDI